jgi:hypothetical protein
MDEGDKALTDAQICRMVRPDWPKACFREGAAQMLLKVSIIFEERNHCILCSKFPERNHCIKFKNPVLSFARKKPLHSLF